MVGECSGLGSDCGDGKDMNTPALLAENTEFSEGEVKRERRNNASERSLKHGTTAKISTSTRRVTVVEVILVPYRDAFAGAERRVYKPQLVLPRKTRMIKGNKMFRED